MGHDGIIVEFFHYLREITLIRRPEIPAPEISEK